MEKDALHVGLVMDGNGRWAQERKLCRTMGHQAGMEALKSIVRACPTTSVKYLTVFGFSTENWSRPSDEVGGLVALIRKYIISELQELDQEEVCLTVIGDKAAFDSKLQDLLIQAERRTQHNTRLYLNVALNYGGRQDIVQACKKAVKALMCLGGTVDDLDGPMLGSYLSTHHCPGLDLLIRTSGEQRVSNFLLWEMAYTELLFVRKYWPDFQVQDLRDCLQEYWKRTRRFGRVHDPAA